MKNPNAFDHTDQIGKLEQNSVAGHTASPFLMNNGGNDNFSPFRYTFGSKYCSPCWEVKLGANFCKTPFILLVNKA